jgi:hypothetical protein
VYKIRLCTLWVTTQLDLSWVRTHPADPLGRPGLPDSQVWLYVYNSGKRKESLELGRNCGDIGGKGVTIIRNENAFLGA